LHGSGREKCGKIRIFLRKNQPHWAVEPHSVSIEPGMGEKKAFTVLYGTIKPPFLYTTTGRFCEEATVD
jgi:hypothetical protein